jgi:hypothetical protein
MRINPLGQYGPVEFDLHFNDEKPKTPPPNEDYKPDPNVPVQPKTRYEPNEELPPDFWG